MKAVNTIQQQGIQQYRNFHIASRAATMATIAKDAAVARKGGKKGKGQGRKDGKGGK